MNIVDEFHKRFPSSDCDKHDFTLFKVKDGFFVGTDEEGRVVVVCSANKPNRAVLKQKTKMLSVECSVKVSYVVDGTQTKGTVHIIRCFAETQREQDIFLELSPLFLEACAHDDQEDAILEVVTILSSFFANNHEPSNNELQGLYAELYTIKTYSKYCDIAHYWQSTDRMKFDFSITDKIKVEVKSTLKSERTHHFRHEQLVTELYEIYIISYMLRHDDKGLPLADLIEDIKPLIQDDPKRLMIIDRYLKNTSENRLKQFKFNEEFMLQNKQIYRAASIPKFGGKTPSGVFNAEYDCVLDNISPMNAADFLSIIMQAMA